MDKHITYPPGTARVSRKLLDHIELGWRVHDGFKAENRPDGGNWLPIKQRAEAALIRREL